MDDQHNLGAEAYVHIDRYLRRGTRFEVDWDAQPPELRSLYLDVITCLQEAVAAERGP